LVEENMKIFNKYNIKQIVTTCPHSYHAFKNRYGKTTFETKHHTQLLANLIDKGKLTFSKGEKRNITYQDPCFLGKQNGIYDEPRKIIKSIPDVNFVELNRSRERSLCCGGGGGRMWVDIPRERLAEIRIKEAIEAGAEIFVTACPFCLLSFEDAIKTMGFEERLKIMDIAELALKAI
jgi:Fe-S oxidoreductase